MMTKWIITVAVIAIALGSTTAHAKEKRRSQAVSGQIEKSKKNIEQNKIEASEKIAAGKPKSSKPSGVLKSGGLLNSGGGGFRTRRPGLDGVGPSRAFARGTGQHDQVSRRRAVRIAAMNSCPAPCRRRANAQPQSHLARATRHHCRIRAARAARVGKSCCMAISHASTHGIVLRRADACARHDCGRRLGLNFRRRVNLDRRFKGRLRQCTGCHKQAKCNQRQYPRPRKTSHLHPG